ncbi:hypothetical protein FB45DRAFT_1010103 [Roridomyces roridus]|uniref:F-box domain-containing protein n=1 Tax=Roridomyces roridus TaxID=1738132 RepID=A0AAD7F917_9AGAR|nr:hypothetical protein FB45DRAFT_1010103 [Roridomyces roridus]
MHQLEGRMRSFEANQMEQSGETTRRDSGRAASGAAVVLEAASELQGLRAEAEPVIVHRAAIQAEETRHYPLETIPDDIVREIFLHSLPAHGSIQPSRYSVPLVLAQICTRWREVLLGTVQLWSSIDFTLEASSSDQSNPHSDGIVQLLHTWFRRAKAHPLSLTVRCSRACVVLPAGLIPLIQQYAPQFSTLALSVPSSQWDEFIRSISGPFPALRHLSLHTQNHCRLLVGPNAFPAFDDMPQLEELHIHIMTRFSNLRLRSKTLTTLKLIPPAITHPLPLESLSLGVALYLHDVTLPHLRNLDVVPHNLVAITVLCSFISRSGTIYNILQSTTILPSLRHLAIVESLHHIGDTMTARPSGHTPSYYTPVVIQGGSGATYTYGYEYDRVAAMLCARAPRTDLKSFELILRPTDHFLQANDPRGIVAEPFIPYGAPAAQIARLREYGLDVSVCVPVSGAPTIYWPPRAAEDEEILAFPACEGAE